MTVNELIAELTKHSQDVNGDCVVVLKQCSQKLDKARGTSINYVEAGNRNLNYDWEEDPRYPVKAIRIS